MTKSATLEKPDEKEAFDTGLDDAPEGEPQTDTEEAGEPVEEKRALKAGSKKALDKLVNELELDGWEIDSLNKNEKFGKDGEIKQTYSATMLKTTLVQV